MGAVSRYADAMKNAFEPNHPTLRAGFLRGPLLPSASIAAEIDAVEAVALGAYFAYVEAGRVDGNDVGHWLAAENAQRDRQAARGWAVTGMLA